MLNEHVTSPASSFDLSPFDFCAHARDVCLAFLELAIATKSVKVQRLRVLTLHVSACVCVGPCVMSDYDYDYYAADDYDDTDNLIDNDCEPSVVGCLFQTSDKTIEQKRKR